MVYSDMAFIRGKQTEARMHTIIIDLVSALRVERAKNAQLRHLLETIYSKDHVVKPTLYKNVARAGKAARQKTIA